MVVQLMVRLLTQVISQLEPVKHLILLMVHSYFANDQISGDKVEGGTINATTINITSTTGDITNVNSTTVDSENLEITNIKARDGTSSATIVNSTGVMTISNQC